MFSFSVNLGFGRWISLLCLVSFVSRLMANRSSIGLPVRATPNQEITFVYVKKRQNGGRNCHKALRVPFPLQWGRFCGEGKDYFRSSGEHIWKSFWNGHKIIAWSYWLYIYAEWLSKYIVQSPMRTNAEPMPFPRSPREKLQLVAVLSLQVKSLSLRERNIPFVDPSVKKKHIHLDI